MEPSFAARLNRLFELVRPLDGDPFTSAEVVDAVRAMNASISRPYMSQLRSGQRNAPSPKVLAALAAFFRVRPEFFTDDEYYRRIEQELEAAVPVDRELIRRIAARAAELSPDSRIELLGFIEQLWQRERHQNICVPPEHMRARGPIGLATAC